MLDGSRFLIAIVALALSAGPAAPTEPAASDPGLFRLRASAPPAAGLDLTFDLDRWREETAHGHLLRITGFPIDAGLTVDLELRRFSVTGPGTRFLLAGPGGASRPIEFDPDRVILLRGHVAGAEPDRVFLALSEHGSIGWIEAAGTRYDVLPGAPGRAAGAAGTGAVRVRRAVAAGGSPLPHVPLCGAPDLAPDLAPNGAPNGAPAAPAAAGLAPPPPTMRVVELAIETDYEYFILHDDLEAAAAYVVQLYGAVSDIFMRDLVARLELTFVRLWDDPDDLFNAENPLGEFRTFWNEEMTDVPRDVAQLLSGRRDLPFGGVAYLGSLCGPSAYSVVGYILGSFQGGPWPNVLSYDPMVTAHELGHNVGALHTHDYGIDQCLDLDGPAQRGTIMSYCSQTVSGGNANTDLRFHSFVRQVIADYFAGSGPSCVHHDCNENGVADSADLLFGSSLDVNFNGVPDECEDCNANGVLDTIDIASGGSADLDANGVPDECQPDCNENGRPDVLDIAQGTSADLHGNGVPDECEVDCDGDGQADYDEIMANMSLDVNRNAWLDACEDCDQDGVTDLEALQGAHGAWVCSGEGGRVRAFHSLTGVRTLATDGAVMPSGEDVLIGSTGRILVSSGEDDRIVEFDRSGVWMGDFVPAGYGGLGSPAGMTYGPAGDLYVANRDDHSVLRFDGATGAFAGAFVAPEAGGLFTPYGLAFGPGGDLYVTSGIGLAAANGSVLRYDGATGAFKGEFVSSDDNGGLSNPHGMVFKPDGNLLVASRGGNQILEYAAGTGAFVGQFNRGGTASALTLDQPWGLRLGPDGNVYVSRHEVEAEPPSDDPFLRDPVLHINSSRIYIFDIRNGNFLRSYVLGHDTGLWAPTGFDFYPGAAIDCNLNGLPDSCDIANGTSRDDDGDGRPDECAGCFGDLDGSGAIGFGDLLLIIASWGACEGCPADLDGSGAVGFADLTIVLSRWGDCP